MLLEHLEAFGGFCTGHFSSREGCSSAKYILPSSAMSRYTRDCGKASSWFSKGWVPSKIHTLDGARGPLLGTIARSGTNVHREVRLRPGAYNPRPGAMQKPRLDERNKNQGRTATNDAVGSKTANVAGNSARDADTEKDATMRRLGWTPSSVE